jgi:hypothetical protein
MHVVILVSGVVIGVSTLGVVLMSVGFVVLGPVGLIVGGIVSGFIGFVVAGLFLLFLESEGRVNVGPPVKDSATPLHDTEGVEYGYMADGVEYIYNDYEGVARQGKYPI